MNTRQRDQRIRRRKERKKERKKKKKKKKKIQVPYVASGEGRWWIRERKPPHEMVIRGPSTMSATGTVL